MGRLPVISRRAILQAALDIIDQDGVEAVTTRRLGSELGVNGASLYYHFGSMDEILAGVPALVLERNAPPEESLAPAAARDLDWKAAMLEAIETYRSCLLEHPNAAWLMLLPASRRYSVKAWALGAQVLVEAGIPPKYALLVMGELEVLAISSVLFASDAEPGPAFEEALGRRRGEPYHSLRAAIRAHASTTTEERFDFVCRAFLEGVAAMVANEPPRRRTRTAVAVTRRRDGAM